jgi:hypothetical protein
MDTKPQGQIPQSAPANPLAKHFRQPAIYLTLPSKGRWWPEGTLDLPQNNEIPIYPMTTKDEILLRTPDALLNGSGVVGVIQSCCPNIKDAWSMPSIDVDPVLIAIRIASYGHRMDFSGQCPHCKEDNDYAIDLRTVNDSIRCPDFSEPLIHGTLKITLRPQQYFALNQTNQLRFEEQRIMGLIMDEGTDDTTRQQLVNESMNRLNTLNLDGLTSSTEFIELDDGTVVNDPAFIREFYENTDSRVIRDVQVQLGKMAEIANVKPVAVSCNSCNQPFNITVTFDYASFFAVGS